MRNVCFLHKSGCSVASSAIAQDSLLKKKRDYNIKMFQSHELISFLWVVPFLRLLETVGPAHPRL